MDELTLFAEQEKTMTTRELAETLEVSERTIKDTAKKMGMEIHFHPFETAGGIQKKIVFNEAQATAIKIELQNHSKVAQNGFDILTVSNDLEGELLVQRAMAWQEQKIRELKSRAEVAEKALDRIESAPGCFTMSQTAKALKLPYGRTTLFKTLREMRLLNGHNEPYQEQINASRFKVVSKVCGDGKNHLVPLVTGKGLVFLAKKFNAEIDESVKADA